MDLKSILGSNTSADLQDQMSDARDHAMLQGLEDRNQATLQRIREFRRDGGTYPEFNQLKHEFPYFCLVACKAGDCDFVLFHANDDQVAWEYQWFGPDKYETEMVNVWLDWCRGGGLVLDIGAYTGLMAILAGLVSSKTEIHLFEPTSRTIERAKMNVRVNGLSRQVKLHNKAVSDKEGVATLNLYREENFVCSGNSLYDKGMSVHGSQTVETVAIDSFMPDIAPALIKIDVEGHELSCLKGMRQAIERSRPRMLIEVWEHTRRQVLDYLEGLGYEYKPFEDSERRVMNFQCEPK